MDDRSPACTACDRHSPLARPSSGPRSIADEDARQLHPLQLSIPMTQSNSTVQLLAYHDPLLRQRQPPIRRRQLKPAIPPLDRPVVADHALPERQRPLQRPRLEIDDVRLHAPQDGPRNGRCAPARTPPKAFADLAVAILSRNASPGRSQKRPVTSLHTALLLAANADQPPRPGPASTTELRLRWRSRQRFLDSLLDSHENVVLIHVQRLRGGTTLGSRSDAPLSLRDSVDSGSRTATRSGSSRRQSSPSAPPRPADPRTNRDAIRPSEPACRTSNDAVATIDGRRDGPATASPSPTNAAAWPPTPQARPSPNTPLPTSDRNRRNAPDTAADCIAMLVSAAIRWPARNRCTRPPSPDSR